MWVRLPQVSSRKIYFSAKVIIHNTFSPHSFSLQGIIQIPVFARYQWESMGGLNLWNRGLQVTQVSASELLVGQPLSQFWERMVKVVYQSCFSSGESTAQRSWQENFLQVWGDKSLLPNARGYLLKWWGFCGRRCPICLSVSEMSKATLTVSSPLDESGGYNQVDLCHCFLWGHDFISWSLPLALILHKLLLVGEWVQHEEQSKHRN